jgi:hypothetical protein
MRTPAVSEATATAQAARRGLAGGSCCALGLAGAMAWLWGFTVDDALVTCRVAEHLRNGVGYRFNLDGPVVDAVTPLGFAYVLAPFAGSGPLAALLAAKWLGALSLLLAGFVLGRRVALRATSAHAAALLLALAVTAPLTAWAVSGMETGVVTALAVGALGRGLTADLMAALAAAWRPELAPWCCALRLGLRLSSGAALARALTSPATVLGAVVLVGAVRCFCFGRVAPLAVFAKPSDLAHGFSYALHAFVQCGLPLLCVAPFSLRRGAPIARAIALAGIAHFGALVLSGGDWMSLYRLAVPVLPSFVLGAAELSRVGPRWASWLRLGLSGAMSVYLAASLGPVARRVGADRQRLIEQARQPLRGARSIAALDVGWVGAVSEARIVDLAGITDEAIAMLPGGHTSKHIDDALLRARDVDALVLLTARPPFDGYDREVERRVSAQPSVAEFRELARLALGGGSQSYVILRKPP